MIVDDDDDIKVVKVAETDIVDVTGNEDSNVLEVVRV